jgi:hypothetical protein
MISSTTRMSAKPKTISIIEALRGSGRVNFMSSGARCPRRQTGGTGWASLAKTRSADDTFKLPSVAQALGSAPDHQQVELDHGERLVVSHDGGQPGDGEAGPLVGLDLLGHVGHALVDGDAGDL